MKHILIAFSLLTISSASHALKPSPYFVVADDYIAPALVKDHEKALVDFKVQADKNGYKGSWRFYAFDDGRHVAFNKQKNHDYEAQDSALWEQVSSKFSKDFLNSNDAVYRKTIVNQNFYLMRHLVELSNEPKSMQYEASPNMVWLELQLLRVPVKKYLVQWSKDLKKQNSQLHFSVYSKQYGANLPSVFIAFHTTSIVDFYQMMAKKGIHDPIKLLPEKLLEGVEKYNVSLAKYIPEISY
ncbi:hypothetical protein [Pseudoalteromonas denitrificans]|uniref:Uncharacterized protein n=1 Tax=Pseudoalteromonas denitrificans DSM 6059 TaxID=1123010 RepID=A0A1I1M1X7_9GAMM|nr:hypothetical protein [Pseudoalteromonas denitrificans]SFC79381.1 hypothetical protein SAMN02745724_02568 [Pseudoalteromonas denitrificans DSM 6059]